MNDLSKSKEQNIKQIHKERINKKSQNNVNKEKNLILKQNIKNENENDNDSFIQFEHIPIEGYKNIILSDNNDDNLIINNKIEIQNKEKEKEINMNYNMKNDNLNEINMSQNKTNPQIEIDNNSQDNKDLFKKIKSNYILKIIFSYTKKVKYELVRYNKDAQKRLDLSINDYIHYYKEYNETVIDIVFDRKKSLKDKLIVFLINSNYSHVYIEEKKEELTIDSIKGITTNKIKLILDAELESFKELFYNYDFISEINFVKCKRRNIVDLSKMFSGCRSLKSLNISELYTNNVTNMEEMFAGCSNLSNLELLNFNTNNV